MMQVLSRGLQNSYTNISLFSILHYYIIYAEYFTSTRTLHVATLQLISLPTLFRIVS